MSQNEKIEKRFSVGDVILLAVILLICGILLFVWNIGKSDGHYVSIMVDGEEIKHISLYDDETYVVAGKSVFTIDEYEDKNNEDKHSENENVTIQDVHTEYNNVILIKDGSVDVTDANCRDKICVNNSVINSVGETIICLPHKLVIEIKAG